MKRQHPLFSPIGCGTALIFMGFVIMSMVIAGGSLFRPGKLTSATLMGTKIAGFTSHAEFENDCMRCHQPWNGPSNIRCVECHTAVETEIASKRGVHSVISLTMECATCHSDHRGRDYSSLTTALKTFSENHQWTGFSLKQHQTQYNGTQFNCTTCHGIEYHFSDNTCTSCHTDHDAVFMPEHIAKYGQNCTACHDGSDKISEHPDHSFFPLTDSHANLACGDCHTGASFVETSPECLSCHTEPAIHLGQFGTDCALCHSPTTWNDTQLKAHTFPLDHAQENNQTIPCETCHVNNYVTNTCYSGGCHDEGSIQDKHIEEGIRDFQNCMSCHPTGREDD